MQQVDLLEIKCLSETCVTHLGPDLAAGIKNDIFYFSEVQCSIYIYICSIDSF